jgi:hypothetical protein
MCPVALSLCSPVEDIAPFKYVQVSFYCVISHFLEAPVCLGSPENNIYSYRWLISVLVVICFYEYRLVSRVRA